MNNNIIIHPFEPVYNENSKVLILGSMPSVQSRENAFYYGNPKNRFWDVLAAVTKQPIPHSLEKKRALLLGQGIALWDVIGQCEISGSADASIRHPVLNDINGLIAKAPIQAVFTNGSKAYSLYDKNIRLDEETRVFSLPSTSPANAAWSLERLIEEWKIIGGFLR